MYEESINNKEWFWQQESMDLFWYKYPEKILTQNSKGFFWWFSDGETNITYNCLDWHVMENPDKIAYHYWSNMTQERSQITYRELLEKVERFSDVLLSFGLQQKERVIIYMPMIIETVVAMLACARVGLVHSVVFGGFSAQELHSRILDSQARLIISASCGLEPHKVIHYPNIVREAISKVEYKINTIYIQRKIH